MRSVVVTQSEVETISVGIEFANKLTQGSVVALFGELGTGKTRFIKGICQGLGVHEHVASPTFTVVNEYAGTGVKVYHFDFYRMKSLTEVQEIGFEEYINNDGICLIEWADKVQTLLPPHRFDVYLKLGRNENIREITIKEIVEIPA